MHILAASSILACAHQLIIDPSSTSPVLPTFYSLFIDDCHPIKIVVGQVEVLPHFILHILALIIINKFLGQLLHFKAVGISYFVSHTSRRMV